MKKRCTYKKAATALMVALAFVLASLTVPGALAESPKLHEVNLDAKALEGIAPEGTTIEVRVDARAGEWDGARFALDMEALLLRSGMEWLTLRMDEMSVFFPKKALEQMASMAEQVTVAMYPRQGAFAIQDGDGSELFYYFMEAPIHVAYEYAPPMDTSSHFFVLDRAEEDGVVVRSWYETVEGNPTGVIRGNVYAPGGYLPIYNAESVFGGGNDTAVNYLAARNVFDGMEFAREDIGNPITRAQFVAMLMRTLDVRLQGAWMPSPMADAADVPEWAFSEVVQARAMGMSLTDGEDSFHPMEMINKEDMYLLAYELMEKTDVAPKMFTLQWILFPDWDDVRPEAGNAIQNLTKMNLSQRDEEGAIHPKAQVSLEDASMFLYDLLTRYGQKKP